MKQLHHGFTIIEIMVYFSLLCVLSFILFSWLTQVVVINKTHAPLLSIHTAGDCFARDIRSADTDKMVVNKNQLIFSSKEKDIGWKLHDGVIQRISGNYDYTNQQWIKKTTSVVARSIDDLSFIFMKENEPKAVFIQMSQNNKTIEETIYLRNGVIYEE